MPPLDVRVTRVRHEAGFVTERRFAGRVAPARRAALGFELGGRLAEVTVEAGAVVSAGDVLARLDRRSLEADRAAALAERAALEAEAELARLTAERRAALQAQGHAATQAFDEARLGLARLEASIAAADARIAGIDLALEKSELRAPFAGEIGTRHLDPGATVAAGTPVVDLFAQGAPELRVGLPAALAAELDPAAQVAVELGDARVAARLVRLRPDLDPATLTREATFVLDMPPGAVRPGFGDTAAVILRERIAAEGFWLPLAALSEGARGSWQVMVAEPEGPVPVARPEAIEVLHTDGARVFVRGAIPQGTPVVADGAHRLVPGQPLAPAEG
jgi:RND family efflux transporter MFP subunit